MTPMKLAEALLLRADQQKKLASLKERIVANAVIQEGDKPQEDVSALLAQAAAIMREHERLVLKIHETNLSARLEDGRSLTAAIGARDTLASRHALLLAAIAGTRKEPERYSVREIKWVAVLPVSELQAQADALAVELRELNARIQETNWSTRLLA
jgi:hypothetical protein